MDLITHFKHHDQPFIFLIKKLWSEDESLIRRPFQTSSSRLEKRLMQLVLHAAITLPFLVDLALSHGVFAITYICIGGIVSLTSEDATALSRDIGNNS